MIPFLRESAFWESGLHSFKSIEGVMGIRMQQVMLRSMNEFSCTWVRYHEDFFAWFAHRLCMHLNIGIGALILTCNPKKPFFPSYSFFLLLSLFFSSHFDSVAFFLSAAFCFQKGKSRVLVLRKRIKLLQYELGN